MLVVPGCMDGLRPSSTSLRDLRCSFGADYGPFGSGDSAVPGPLSQCTRPSASERGLRPWSFGLLRPIMGHYCPEGTQAKPGRPRRGPYKGPQARSLGPQARMGGRGARPPRPRRGPYCSGGSRGACPPCGGRGAKPPRAGGPCTGVGGSRGEGLGGV